MRTARVVLLISLATLAAGCAAGGETRTAPQSQSAIVFDSDYVARVDNEARRRNVGVHWVNPPRRDPPPR